MSATGERFMRMLVLFDLPTLSKEDRKNANTFRRDLVKDGYNMLQLSIYARLCKGMDTVNKHINRLKNFLPPNGSVRLLVVTEKQYAGMEILVGVIKKQEKIAPKQLLLL